MASQFSPDDPADDPLALFGTETETPIAKPAPAKRAAVSSKAVSSKAVSSKAVSSKAVPSKPGQPAERPRTDLVESGANSAQIPAARPRDVSVEVVGPPPPSGAVSFAHVRAIKDLGFVDGVALVEAACQAVRNAGSDAGVPELRGIFLTATGAVTLSGPPTGEPAARELARLLHELVAPNLMPPAGRLFVGRWIDSDAHDLTEFTTELAYFARPNGRELLAGLHGRCAGVAIADRPRERTRPDQPREDRRPKATPETPKSQVVPGLLPWVRRHKPEVTAAIAVVAAATATAIATLLWAPGTVEASKDPTGIELSEDASSPDGVTKASRPGTRARAPRVPPSRPRGPVAAPPPTRSATPEAAPAVIEPQDSGPVAAVIGSLPPVPSRPVPDLKIYTAADSSVEPPRLRSAEIPELLIAGFEKRANNVELLISERGDVQQARMIGPPQRMPDIMLLSRAKELQFDPALKNGTPVRYRLVLTWNVTP